MSQTEKHYMKQSQAVVGESGIGGEIVSGSPERVDLGHGTSLEAVFWDRESWVKLCEVCLPARGQAVFPAAILTDDGTIHADASVRADREILLRAVGEELMHRELGFPAESGRSEIMAKLYREALVSCCGFEPMELEEIVGEIVALYSDQNEHVAQALRVARTVSPDFDEDKALRIADSISGKLPEETRTRGGGYDSHDTDSCGGAKRIAAAKFFDYVADFFKTPERRQAELNVRMRAERRELDRAALQYDTMKESMLSWIAKADRDGDVRSYDILKQMFSRLRRSERYINVQRARADFSVAASAQGQMLASCVKLISPIVSQLDVIYGTVDFSKIEKQWALAEAQLGKLERQMDASMDLASSEFSQGADSDSELDASSEEMIRQYIAKANTPERRGIAELRDEIEHLRRRPQADGQNM